MKTLPEIDVMRRALRERNPAYDGIFFVAVRTTGIFCRPVCRAKPPKFENVEFFATAKEALHHGYRPCKLCRPMDAGRQPPELVARLMRLVEEHPAERYRERELQAMGIDASTARRQFRRYCKMTFAAYQRARRMGRAMTEIRSGRQVSRAQIGAGFESGSGFRAACARVFGATAKKAGGVCALPAKWLTTPLGPMIVIASEEGIVLLDFVDRKGLDGAVQRLRKRFATAAGPAAIIPGEHRHLNQAARELKEYFDGVRRDFSVPVFVRGTAFEAKAWEYLRSVPAGRTRTYGEQAAAMGNPKAVRAVGRANGMNYVSIVIPCHRVIAADGKLAGYGGGLARKQWLLDHERAMVAATKAA